MPEKLPQHSLKCIDQEHIGKLASKMSLKLVDFQKSKAEWVKYCVKEQHL